MASTIAARALGSDRVLGVSMPTRYSSQASRQDAEALASAIREFEAVPGAFTPEECRRNAEGFSRARFLGEMRAALEEWVPDVMRSGRGGG